MTLNNKIVPNIPCPKCGANLIVKEHKMRQRGTAERVTLFIGCTNFLNKGCNYTQPFTEETRKAIEAEASKLAETQPDF